MPSVTLKKDNLDQLNKNYEQATLPHPVFLNSVPKCGTHLIKNICRMFVPVEQQYHDAFVQIPILRQHLGAFDVNTPKLSWGHLLFSDDSAKALKDVTQIIIVRDPFDWVLARARFFLSDSFKGSLDHLKNGAVSIEQFLNMMIFGIHGKAPTLNEIYTHNAVSWLGTGVTLIKYEDIIHHVKNIDTAASEAFFATLLSHFGYDSLPDDWQARIQIGADREQSGTARENLSGTVIELPSELPIAQKQLVEYAAPGLRHILGYV
ncbi:hypothetical protein [Agaribacter marinus]|uniref:Sulfotransferase domain-containing protein n=1 Tax=Agaribacter marinus TaxID=1431249 RepID=A0AA37WKL3_9ALTE|nr:hypothetical protein [Agaribacter marinus]GLR71090.1 hypothetical protein GCM10007852_19980 [Agaribacter marinus]